MDATRLDTLWSSLCRLVPRMVPFFPNHKAADLVNSFIKDFVDILFAVKNEGVLLRMMWSLDRGIERGLFTPQ